MAGVAGAARAYAPSERTAMRSRASFASCRAVAVAFLTSKVLSRPATMTALEPSDVLTVTPSANCSAHVRPAGEVKNLTAPWGREVKIVPVDGRHQLNGSAGI